MNEENNSLNQPGQDVPVNNIAPTSEGTSAANSNEPQQESRASTAVNPNAQKKVSSTATTAVLPPPVVKTAPKSRQPVKNHIPSWVWVLLILGALVLCGSICFNLILMFMVAGEGTISSSGNNTFSEKVVEGRGSNKILYLPLTGVITSSQQEYGPAIKDRMVIDMLNQALNDKNIKGAIIEINSPGGEVTASDKINQAITEFAKKKPLYILMGDICASGGVYMSTHATKIYAHPTTTTGSIGVIMHGYNIEELLGKIGVKEVIYKSGEMKDILSPTREATEAEKALLQQLIMDSYNRFVTLVASGRNLDIEKVKEFADGRILSADQAKSYGLIDEIAYYSQVKDDLLAAVGLSDATVITYKRPFSLMDFSGAEAIKAPTNPLSQLNALNSPRLMYLWQLPDME